MAKAIVWAVSSVLLQPLAGEGSLSGSMFVTGYSYRVSMFQLLPGAVGPSTARTNTPSSTYVLARLVNGAPSRSSGFVKPPDDGTRPAYSSETKWNHSHRLSAVLAARWPNWTLLVPVPLSLTVALLQTVDHVLSAS